MEFRSSSASSLCLEIAEAVDDDTGDELFVVVVYSISSLEILDDNHEQFVGRTASAVVWHF